MPAGGSEYTPELIEEAIKKSYKKCGATRGTNHPRREENNPDASRHPTSSGFRSKRLANRQVRTGRWRARLRNQGNHKPTNLQAAIDQAASKLRPFKEEVLEDVLDSKRTKPPPPPPVHTKLNAKDTKLMASEVSAVRKVSKN